MCGEGLFCRIMLERGPLEIKIGREWYVRYHMKQPPLHTRVKERKTKQRTGRQGKLIETVGMEN